MNSIITNITITIMGVSVISIIIITAISTLTAYHSPLTIYDLPFITAYHPDFSV